MSGKSSRHALALSAWAMFAAGGAAAQTPTPPEPTPSEDAFFGDDDGDEIIVVAPQNETRIDRRTYLVRSDPAAQTTDMLDVLGRIPSVSVDPSGAVSLLGSGDVNIQVNGQPLPAGSAEQVLRGLMGGEIERIEVVTNPSAQFSSEGTGGIINIITRQRYDGGFGGSLTSSLDTQGGYNLNVSPNWTGDHWTFSGRAMYGASPNESDLDRERRDFASGNVTTERAHTDSDREMFGGNAQATYRPNEQRRFTLSLNSFNMRPEQDQALERADNTGPLATQRLQSETEFGHSTLDFDFQQTGEEDDREVLKLRASLRRFEHNTYNRINLSPVGGADSAFATTSDNLSDSLDIELDYERPLPNDHFLTVGAAYDQGTQEVDSARQTLIGAPSTADYRSSLDGNHQTVAAYATYQFDTGDWTWLPSVRFENYRREVVSGGLETDDWDERIFPSLHIRRRLNSSIDVDLSYSSRIQRPWISQLDPSLRFSDADRASSGNPNLAPTTTDAFEASLNYQSGRRSFSVTLFDRTSDDIVSQLTEVNADGVIVTMPVNAGESVQRGAQFILRGPLWENWRYSASVNLLNREFDVLSGGSVSQRSEFEYDGNAQIEYRDPDQNAIHSNFYQLDLRFRGPRYSLQSETDPYITANFTWRHRLTDKLTSTLSVQDIFDSSDQTSDVTTVDYFERSEIDRDGQRIRFSLNYQFGAPPPRSQQMQQMQQMQQPQDGFPGGGEDGGGPPPF